MVHCQSGDLGLSRINVLTSSTPADTTRFILQPSHFQTDGRTHPLAQYLVDGGALFHFALSHHLGPLVSHIQHEGVERLLDVGLPLVVLLLLAVGRRPTARGTHFSPLVAAKGSSASKQSGVSSPRLAAAAAAAPGLLLDPRVYDGGVGDGRLGGGLDQTWGEAA